MLVAAAAIALTSRGPIIFRQERLGKGGVPFIFYKFRSMVVNGDDRIHREFVSTLIKGNQAQSTSSTVESAPFKLQCDPRITRIGSLIRKTSIDELPQLFNVLKGDMSLVGPRPPIPYEAKQYQSWHLQRILAVKPGITGLWQVAGAQQGQLQRHGEDGPSLHPRLHYPAGLQDLAENRCGRFSRRRRALAY